MAVPIEPTAIRALTYHRPVARTLVAANLVVSLVQLGRAPCGISLVQTVWWLFGCHQWDVPGELVLSLPVLDRLATSPLGPFLRHTTRTGPGPRLPASGAALTCLLVSGIGLLTLLLSLLVAPSVALLELWSHWLSGRLSSVLAFPFTALLTAGQYMACWCLPGFTLKSTDTAVHLHWSLSWLSLAPIASYLVLWGVAQITHSLYCDVRAYGEHIIGLPTPASSPSLSSVKDNQGYAEDDATQGINIRKALFRSTQTLTYLEQQLTPTVLMSNQNRPELLASCSIPIPTSVLLAVHSFIQHIRYLGKLLPDPILNAQLHPGTDPALLQDVQLMDHNYTMRDHKLWTTFDLVDLIQVVADIHAGLSAVLDQEVLLGNAIRVQTQLAVSERASVTSSTYVSSDPLDSPHRDMAAWVHGPYDGWYHILCATLWAILVSSPTSSCVEFGFLLQPADPSSPKKRQPSPRPSGPSTTFQWILRLRDRTTKQLIDPTEVEAHQIQSTLHRLLTDVRLFLRAAQMGYCTTEWVTLPTPHTWTLPVTPTTTPATVYPASEALPSGQFLRALCIHINLPFESFSHTDRASPSPLVATPRARAAYPSHIADPLDQIRSRHHPFQRSQSEPSPTPVDSTEASGYFPSPGQAVPEPPLAPSSPSITDVSHDHIASFLQSLRGFTMSLYYSPQSLFAAKIIDFLTHRSDVKLKPFMIDEQSSQSPGQAAVQVKLTRPSGNKRTRVADLNSGSNRNRRESQGNPAKDAERRPHAFIIIDDHLPTLEHQFMQLRNTLSFDYTANSRGSQASQSSMAGTPYGSLSAGFPSPWFSTSGSNGNGPNPHASPSLNPPAQHRLNVSASTIRATSIIYFTSVGNYKEVKAVLHRLHSTPHALPAPDVLVLPKPAGTKRFVSALYVALHRPVLDSTVNSTAVSPPVMSNHGTGPSFLMGGTPTASYPVVAGASPQQPHELYSNPELGSANHPLGSYFPHHFSPAYQNMPPASYFAPEVLATPFWPLPTAPVPHSAAGGEQGRPTSFPATSAHVGQLGGIVNSTAPRISPTKLAWETAHKPHPSLGPRPHPIQIPDNKTATSPISQVLDHHNGKLPLDKSTEGIPTPVTRPRALPTEAIHPPTPPAPPVLDPTTPPQPIPTSPAAALGTSPQGGSHWHVGSLSSPDSTNPTPTGSPNPAEKPVTKTGSRMKNRLDQIRKNAARRRLAAEGSNGQLAQSPLQNEVSQINSPVVSGEASSTTSTSAPANFDAGMSTTPPSLSSSPVDIYKPAQNAETAYSLSVPALLRAQTEGTVPSAPPILTSSAAHLLSKTYSVRGAADLANRADSLVSLDSRFSSNPAPTIPPIKVLIVEDSLVDRRIINRFMTNHGVRHELASTGKEAIRKWNQDVYHLVFMDLQLPDMSGIEITREIRRLEEKRMQDIINRQNGLGAGGRVTTPSTWSANQLKRAGSTVFAAADLPPAMLQHTSSAFLSASTSADAAPRTANSPAIIVALTASNLDSDRMAAYAAGCNDFLIKPIDTHWMRQKLLEWGAMHALIDFEGFKSWKVEDAKRRQQAKKA
ncbi:response regulator [Dimargaris cristalligena]|nr:response regulator [Dimargaris cristalligena]